MPGTDSLYRAVRYPMKEESPIAKSLRTRRKKKNKLLFPLICLFILLISILGYLFFLSGDSEPRIAKHVTISGIPVGGMTSAEARAALEGSLDREWETRDFILQLPNKKHNLTPIATKVHWDIDKAISEALSQSADSQADIPVVMALDSDYIRQELASFAEALGGIYTASGFWLEGNAPDFTNPDTPCQTLVLSKGKPGIALDTDDICRQILDAYTDKTFYVAVTDVGTIRQPDALNLESISGQLYSAPINPTLNKESMEVIPGKMGYSFDVETAAVLLEQAAPGESVRIPMHLIAPEISEEDVWYQDTLGSCSTPHSDNSDRTDNLILACSTINGTILQPGETFSYNKALGERTVAAGYKAAPAYAGTELVDSIGGGICQVSSTLYLSSLFAELKTVERRNHGYPVNYIPLGLDAAVNWGTTDLKLRNDYDLPVKILADVSDGYVHVRIMGVETRDYTVQMEYRVDDPKYASAYLHHIDNTTGEIISTSFDHTSIYLQEVWGEPGFAESN